MGDKIRVGRVGWHSCIRGFKQCLALKDYGVETHWICHRNLPTHYSFHHFNTINVYQLGDGESIPKAPEAYNHFRSTIEFLDPHVDLWHVDNEPNWFVHVIKQISSKPIVFDLHDLTSEREFVVHEDERLAFANCDAIITQSDNYSQVASALRPDLAKAGLIDHVFCAVNRSLWPELNLRIVANGQHKLGGLVYEGGICESLANKAEFRYRWWLPFMEPVANDNIPVFVYAAGPGQYMEYRKAGVSVQTNLPFKDLLRHLTLHDWGLLGNTVNHPAFDNAMPNKLFEYTAAGLPVMVYNAKQASELVQREQVGVIIKHPSDVKHFIANCGDFHKNVLEFREKYCMENEVQKVLKVYDKLLKR